MGMDIYSKSGVVFPAEELAAHLFGKLTKPKVAAAVAELRKIFAASKNNEGVAYFPESEKALDSIKLGGDIAEWFNNLLRETLTDSYGDYYFSDDDILNKTWDVFVAATGLDLPAVTFEYWSKPRLNGWDVPADTPCVVFEPDNLFETKMTKEGKKLAKLLKLTEISQTTWTIMSV